MDIKHTGLVIEPVTEINVEPPKFVGWGSTPRLSKDMIITEKVDGANAALIIRNVGGLEGMTPPAPFFASATVKGATFWLGAQSRNRLITPEQDNAGFAAYVRDNAEGLARVLGSDVQGQENYHFGEWYGNGVQKSHYGLQKGHKRFALFNVKRWAGDDNLADVPGLETVPVLYKGPFDTEKVVHVMQILKESGSKAGVPGNDTEPEGVVVFHEASRQVYKKTFEGDDAHKWEIAQKKGGQRENEALG